MVFALDWMAWYWSWRSLTMISVWFDGKRERRALELVTNVCFTRVILTRIIFTRVTFTRWKHNLRRSPWKCMCENKYSRYSQYSNTNMQAWMFIKYSHTKSKQHFDALRAPSYSSSTQGGLYQDFRSEFNLVRSLFRRLWFVTLLLFLDRISHKFMNLKEFNKKRLCFTMFYNVHNIVALMVKLRHRNDERTIDIDSGWFIITRANMLKYLFAYQIDCYECWVWFWLIIYELASLIG